MAYAIALNVSKMAINDVWDKIFENYDKIRKQKIYNKK